MGLLKTIRTQLGLSNTATQNFTLTAEAADGTMKLARGNAGATTQDIITVASDGKVDFPQLSKTLATNGSYTLPGGLIIKWGTSITNSTTSPNATVSFSNAFPTACAVCLASPQGANPNTYVIQTSSVSASNATFTGSLGTSILSGIGFSWIAIGY